MAVRKTHAAHADPANDIELYRKKRRRRRTIRRFFTVTAVILLAGVFLFLASRFDFSDISELMGTGNESGNIVQNDGETVGFPKKLFGDRPLQFERSGSSNSLAMVTDRKLYLYGTEGQMLLNLPHSYTRPAIFSEGKRVLLYDRGGNQFQVVSERGTVYEKEIANEVICGVVNGGGSAAIVTNEERYAGSVTVFNPQGEQQFKWYCSEGRITGVDLRDDGKLAVSCIGAKDGAISSTVYLMNAFDGEDQKVASAIFSDMMILSANFKNGDSLCVTGDTKAVTLSLNGEVRNEYVFDKTIVNFFAADKGYTLLLLSASAHSDDHILVLLNSSGSSIGTAELHGEIEWLDVCDNSVYVLTDEKVLQYNNALELLKEVPVRADADRIASIGSKVYVLGLGEIFVAES